VEGTHQFLDWKFSFRRTLVLYATHHSHPATCLFGMTDRAQIPSSSGSSGFRKLAGEGTEAEEGSATVVSGETGVEDGTGEGTREKPAAIELHIPPRFLVLPGAGAVTGLSIGLIRGARMASWRFLAENAHRAPTTMKGWYFYKKTKNYRMMWGGLKEGGKDAVKLGVVGLAWASLEDGIARIGGEEVKEVGAGLGTAAMFSTVYRLPWITTRRALVLGTAIGCTMSGLRWGQSRLRGLDSRL